MMCTTDITKISPPLYFLLQAPEIFLGQSHLNETKRTVQCNPNVSKSI